MRLTCASGAEGAEIRIVFFMVYVLFFSLFLYYI